MTIGTIYSWDENVVDSFNTVDDPSLTTIIGTGSYTVNFDSITVSGDKGFILRPSIIHSYDNFTLSLKCSLSSSYEFELGLSGVQISNSLNRLLNITRVNDTTVVKMYNLTGQSELFSKTFPVVFTDDLEVKISYANRTWKIALINQGRVYDLSYRYDREMSGGGNRTSKFLLNNIDGELSIYKLEVKVNSPRQATVFIGDSITCGAKIPFGTGGTFVEQYAKVNGNTTVFASGSANSIDIVNALPSLTLLDPTKVFILIGDNDNYNDVPGFINRIESIHSNLSNLPSSPDIYILNCTPEISDEGYWNFNQALNDLGLSVDYNIINVWDALARLDNPKLVQSQYVVDNVHLSQLGHNTIYQLVQNY